MSSKSKREYIEAIRSDYRRSCKAQKTIILNHFCTATKLDRKYAIRLMSKTSAKIRERSGRPPKYDKDKLLPHLTKLWRTMERIGSKKLKAALPGWLPHYRGEGVTVEITEEIKVDLLNLSASTLERFLKEVRFQNKPHGYSTTRRGNILKNRIPIKPLDWNVTKPGFVEGDTVAHCGDNIEGEYGHSLNATDILTTWTETRATFTKASGGIIERMKEIEKAFPFRILGFNSDNGSEFLNHAFVEHFENRKENPIPVKRGRPYRKNDQCFIEQKNLTHVRGLFEYDRVETKALVELMNEIYRDYWCPLQNFFIPTMKLIRKERIGAKIKKKYELPKTPYERVLACPDVPEENKKALRERYATLNPFELKAQMEKKLQVYFQLLRKREFNKAA